MSRSKQVSKYPQQFLTLAAEFEGEKRRRVKTVSCGDEREAKRLRLDLYGFQGAIRAEGMQADYPHFLTVRMFVKGRVLRLMHADETAKALK
jgi:hypothetical protein